MIPVVIGFGIIALIAGGAAVLLPVFRASLGRSRRRRRSKSRKTHPASRQRLHSVDLQPGSDDGQKAGR